MRGDLKVIKFSHGMLREERVIFKVALCGALVGILMLFWVSARFSTDAVAMSAVEIVDVGTKIVVKGEITKVGDTPAVMIIDVEDGTGSVRVVVFKDGKMSLKKGLTVEVEGEVVEYKGRREIEAKKVRVF